MTTHTLDAKDLTCPLPVLRARKAMKHLAPGDILEVAATDPAAVRDFPAFCEATGTSWFPPNRRGRSIPSASARPAEGEADEAGGRRGKMALFILWNSCGAAYGNSR